MPDPINHDVVRLQVERIATNPPLESSPSLCRFLRFVVEETLEGRASALKEYTLGVAVFGRGEEFDPRLDPIVRVQARNLRVRLAQYYAAAGADDPVIIDLPKRTYVPTFHAKAAPVAESPPAAPATAEKVSPPPPIPAVPARRRFDRFRGPVIALALCLAAAAVLWKGQPHATHARIIVEPDPAAQDFYIRGRYIMDRQTERSLRESIDSFQRALARDPRFAAAYAGVAQAYNLLAQYGYVPPGEGMEQARRAAQRAIEIDPELADAHVALAAVMEAYDWNWDAAEKEYRRAIKLNQWLPAAHLWFGMFLRDQGRLQEALPELRRAAQLEPFSVLTALNLAYAYNAAGNREAALDQALHVTELAPQHAGGFVLLSNIYRAQKKTAEAEAALARARELATGPHEISAVACAYAFRGKRETATEMFHELEEIAATRYVSPFDLGAVSLGLGDEARALELLEEAYRQRSSGLIFLRDAHFNAVRNSAQFHALVERMHFAG